MEDIEELEDIHKLPQLEIRFMTAEQVAPSLEEVGLFLFDLTVLFELQVANSLPAASKAITRFSLYRNHARVPEEHRLRVQRISLASPLEIIAVIAASTAAGATAIWSAVQAIERLAMLRLNREKARAEIAKLNEETRKLQDERLRSSREIPVELVQQLPEEQDAASKELAPDEVIQSATRRLESHGIKLQQIEVQYKSDPSHE